VSRAAQGAAGGALVRIEGVSVLASNGGSGLEGVDLALGGDEVWVAFGREGAGTSDLLRAIVGDTRLAAGRIEVLGVDVGRARPAEIRGLRRRIGYVFRETGLLGNMSLEDNLALPIRYHTSLHGTEIARRIEPLVSLFGLQAVRRARPAEVDHLTRKRAAFARALSLDPDILLADYPLEGLDPVGSARFLEIMAEVARRPGRLSFVATCELDIYGGFGERFLMMEGGRMLWQGGTRELASATHPAVRQYLDRSTRGPLATF
jgi:ABC-type transporter Mla maintaining outer membrane lipid asymmetry ATPase subunit MlaF